MEEEDDFRHSRRIFFWELKKKIYHCEECCGDFFSQWEDETATDKPGGKNKEAPTANDAHNVGTNAGTNASTDARPNAASSNETDTPVLTCNLLSSNDKRENKRETEHAKKKLNVNSVSCKRQLFSKKRLEYYISVILSHKANIPKDYAILKEFSIKRINVENDMESPNDDINDDINHDIIDDPSKIKLIKHGKYIVALEDLFDVILNAHIACGHGGVRRTLFHLKNIDKIGNITKEQVTLFVSLCFICKKKVQMGKNLQKKNGKLVKPIISRGFNHRIQVDLIDLSSFPCQKNKSTSSYIMVYQDHLTKYVLLYPLRNKKAITVYRHLLLAITTLGCPRILQSDNGTEFKMNIKLKRHFPELKIIKGRPRHPQSQGSVERANADIMSILRCWLSEHNTTDWVKALPFIQMQKNMAYNRTINACPYFAVFGTYPVSYKGEHCNASSSVTSPSQNKEKLVPTKKKKKKEKKNMQDNKKMCSMSPTSTVPVERMEPEEQADRVEPVVETTQATEPVRPTEEEAEPAEDTQPSAEETQPAQVTQPAQATQPTSELQRDVQDFREIKPPEVPEDDISESEIEPPPTRPTIDPKLNPIVLLTRIRLDAASNMIKTANKLLEKQEKIGHTSQDVLTKNTIVVLRVPKVDRHKLGLPNLVCRIRNFFPETGNYNLCSLDYSINIEGCYLRKDFIDVLNQNVIISESHLKHAATEHYPASLLQKSNVSLRTIVRYENYKFIGCNCVGKCINNVCFCRRVNKACSATICKHKNVCKNRCLSDSIGNRRTKKKMIPSCC